MNLNSLKKMLSLQSRCCFYCGKEIAPPTKRGRRTGKPIATRDHVIPRSAAPGLPRNVVLACLCCNHEKSDRLPTSEELQRAAALWVMMPRRFGGLA